MRNKTLIGAAFAVILALAVVVPAYGAHQGGPFQAKMAHGKPTPPITKGVTLRISGTGTAFNITDQSIHHSASIDLTVTVDKSSPGRARLNVTGGELTVASENFKVDKGRGIINFHSDKIVIHVHLKDSKDKTVNLILYGKLTAKITSPLNKGSSFTVDFVKPQSKVAGKWFLEFKGATVTRIG